MKKPPFKQLKGTPAQKVRHRICLGFSVATLVVSLLFGCGLFQFYPRPESPKDDRNIKDFLRERNFRSLLQRKMEVAGEKDDKKIAL